MNFNLIADKREIHLNKNEILFFYYIAWAGAGERFGDVSWSIVSEVHLTMHSQLAWITIHT